MEVNYRYSDSSFCAYLKYLGYSPISYDIVEKRGNKPKVFIHFKGDKDELINILNDYKENKVNININEYSNCKSEVLLLIRLYLNEHYKKQEEGNHI